MSIDTDHAATIEWENAICPVGDFYALAPGAILGSMGETALYRDSDGRCITADVEGWGFSIYRKPIGETLPTVQDDPAWGDSWAIHWSFYGDSSTYVTYVIATHSSDVVRHIADALFCFPTGPKSWTTYRV